MFLNKILNLNRFKKSLIMIFADICIVLFSILLCLFLRDEIYLISDYKDFIYYVTLLIVSLSIPIFVFFDLYKSKVRYMGYKAMLFIIYAVSFLAFILFIFSLLSGQDLLTVKTIFLFWLLLIFQLIGSRQIARWLINSIGIDGSKRDMIVYGAGSAGRAVISTLAGNKNVRVIGFLDDKKDLHGLHVNNYPVLGDLQYLKSMNKVNQKLTILLAAPSMNLKRRREILKTLESNSISVRSLPPLSEIIVGMTNIKQIEQIRPEELLDRDPVLLDKDKIKASIKGKSILITGAGGSIGSELSRQIFQIGPKKLILLDHSELNLYNIYNELLSYSENRKLAVKVDAVLGSVLDPLLIDSTIKNYSIDSIYHAAAYKHVNLVEKNIIQGTINNVLGTYNIAMKAFNNNVPHFVHISTDKAVRPTNIMGASKRMAELIIQGLMASSKNKSFTYTMVRFGNVLGSSGSVIPLFTKQIQDGGPVTVTHPDVTRFFMTISEASQLVIDAGVQARGGEVFVLDMGESVKINDLAKRMIRLSGFSIADKDDEDPYSVSIKYVGLRPGEKLYEELILGNDLEPTENQKVFKANEDYIEWDEVKKMIAEIEEAIKNENSDKIKSIMIKYVTDFKPSSN